MSDEQSRRKHPAPKPNPSPTPAPQPNPQPNPQGVGVGPRPAGNFHPVTIADINNNLVTHTYVQITGTIDQAHDETDGDVHLHVVDASVTPAPGQPPAALIQCDRVFAVAGSLVCEIVPETPLPAPALGAKVTITGTLRFDKTHNWPEIHPVAAITVW